MSPDGARRWPFWARALVGVFAAVGAAYCALLVWVSLGHVCFVEDTAVVPSPSGTIVAHVSLRTCKPDVPLTEVTLQRRGSTSATNSSQTVFEAAATPRDDGGYSPIRVYVSWVDDGEMQISYPYAQRFESRAEDAMGVKVSYHEVSPR